MLRTAIREVNATGRYVGRIMIRRASGTGTVTTSLKQNEVKVAPPGDGPNHRSVMTLDAHTIRPFVQPNAFVAPSASVIGSVTVNDFAAVMYGTVVRGDLALIHVGVYTTICENSVVTAGKVRDGSLSPVDAVSVGLPMEPEMIVGDFCYVGANCRLHSCFLDGDNVIGHGAVIDRGARIERYAQILPGSWVPTDVVVPEGEIWAGSPAVKVGTVSDDAKKACRKVAIGRKKTTAAHLWEFLPYGTVYLEKEALAKAT